MIKYETGRLISDLQTELETETKQKNRNRDRDTGKTRRDKSI